MTISLIATAIIVALGALVIWLMVARRGALPPAAPGPAPGPAPAEEEPMHGALNLYLTAPALLPAGAARVELTLVKAALGRGDGTERTFFEGSRRLMLQDGTTEKLLSDVIPNGRWTRLKLTFSPVAELAYADGRPATPAVLGRREAALSFDAEVPISRTLALFARLPIGEASGALEGATTLELPGEPVAAERYVLGGFLPDPRDRGEILVVAAPTLASVVREDLGLDITRALEGSTGFVPAATAPEPAAP